MAVFMFTGNARSDLCRRFMTNRKNGKIKRLREQFAEIAFFNFNKIINAKLCGFMHAVSDKPIAITWTAV